MKNKITHEEAKYIIYKNSTISGVKIEDTNKLIDYNTQQEAQSKRLAKVEELLGLIKERAIIDNDLSMAKTKHDRDVIRVVWWENNAKIKALEEEIK